MHDTLPPYIEAKDYLPVRAVVRGQTVEGVVLGWRGEQVYLRWKTDMGNHLGWVAATDVERRLGSSARSTPASTYETQGGDL